MFDNAANRNVSRVQNIEQIRTRGIEAAFNGSDVLMRGLDLTRQRHLHPLLHREERRLRRRTRRHDRQVAAATSRAGAPPATATWRFDPDLSASVGLRYSGKQYRTLDNSDVNGFTYMGVSSYFTTDLRLRWRTGAAVDRGARHRQPQQLQYWNFHPYPQRSYSAELKWDL